MAYVLGFFAADGYMWTSSRGAKFFGFQITDKELLYTIRKHLESTHKISARLGKKKGWSDCYRLQIGSLEMFEDLLRLGMTPAKSNTLLFPTIPPKYQPAFVRGYFDGDGNVYFKSHYMKARRKHEWAFTSRFTCNSRTFLESLHALLRRNGVRGGVIRTKSNGRGVELVLSRRDSLALYNFMYNNAPVDLQLARKRTIFETAIDTLRMRS